MISALKAATENLYDVFSIYQMPVRMEGCPCCVSEGDKEKIHFKKLKEITGDDISRYAVKAMTTWGSVEDFKCYLPRIFELLLSNEFYPDLDVILGKLEYGAWHLWDQKEQEAVRTFLMAWWRQVLCDEGNFGNVNFTEIHKALGSVKPLLDVWEVDIEGNSFRLLVSLIFEYYSQYKFEKSFSKEDYMELSHWIKRQESILEQGFYKYEKLEPDFAQNISYSYDIVHRIAL
jgi:hypothetical protein